MSTLSANEAAENHWKAERTTWTPRTCHLSVSCEKGCGAKSDSTSKRPGLVSQFLQMRARSNGFARIGVVNETIARSDRLACRPRGAPQTSSSSRFLVRLKAAGGFVIRHVSRTPLFETLPNWGSLAGDGSVQMPSAQSVTRWRPFIGAPSPPSPRQLSIHRERQLLRDAVKARRHRQTTPRPAIEGRFHVIN